MAVKLDNLTVTLRSDVYFLIQCVGDDLV